MLVKEPTTSSGEGMAAAGVAAARRKTTAPARKAVSFRGLSLSRYAGHAITGMFARSPTARAVRSDFGCVWKKTRAAHKWQADHGNLGGFFSLTPSPSPH